MLATNETTEQDFQFSDFFDGDSTALDFKMSDFTMIDDNQEDKRYIKPKFSKRVITVKYENAQKLVKGISLFPGEQIHTIVNSNFIFGDLIESLIIDKDVICEDLYISTLSMSQNNIDSLSGLVHSGRDKKLTHTIANYFYSNEKNKLMK